jgi:hypothetical protein
MEKYSIEFEHAKNRLIHHLQQLKLKVIEITPTKPTTFQNGVQKR